jgi:diguanylate cyclase (GGDEF)-like protein
MVASNKASEKRRYRRRGTNVEAVMTVGETASIQCAILDFCEQGLFLQLTQPTSIGLQKGKETKIYFSAHTESAREYFQIDAQIARVDNNGVGVAFTNISEAMFAALTKSTNAGSIAAHSKDPRFFLTSSNQERFRKEFKQMLEKNMPALLRVFFSDVEDELEKKHDFAHNFRDVAAQSNLISVVRLNKEKLITAFCGDVTNHIDFTSDKDKPKQPSDVRESDLSLVEKDTFEDWLSFSTLIRKITAQYKNQLYQLELKLSYVTCFPRYLIKNPIDPERLCESFRDEIASIEDSVATKKILYTAFQTTLSKQLSALYNIFDALLVQHGAPSGIAQDIIWKRNYPTASKPSEFPEEGFSGLGQHPLPSFDNSSYHYDDTVRHSAPESPPQRLVSHPPVTQTVSRLFDLIQQNLAASRGGVAELNQPQGQVSAVHPVVSEYSPDELLVALTKLQASRVAQPLSEETGTSLLNQLEESMATSAYFGDKSVSSEDKAKLDVYDQLFQALLSELALTPNIKSYLESIKVPLMALTLQDPEFLNSENHPARNLLNQLFALDSAINQNKVVKNAQVKNVLDKLVSKVAQGSINNPDIFAKANEELKEISAPINRSREANIRRVIELYEGKQKLEKARQTIQLEIDECLSGKTVPNVIQALLESGWQHLLLMTELNDEAEDKQRYLEVIVELVGWYTDLDKLPEEQYSVIEMELEFINQKLGTACTNAFTHNKIMEELNATLVGVGFPRIRKAIDKSFIQPKAKTPPNEFISDRWYLEVDQFEVGEWFTFSLEREAFEPLKLVWVGEIPQIYVFVNRDGYKKQELTRNELAELLQSGVVAQIENLDEPVMDRATTTMLQQMQDKLIHSVSHDTVTNLPNRKRFINLIKEKIVSIGDLPHVLGYLEIEDFRIITNVCGLVGGDRLLQQVARLMSEKLGNDSAVARLGDKTFGFLLQNVTSDEGKAAAQKIRDLINKSNFVWNDKSYTISVSIGLVPIMNGMQNAEDLLQKADTVNISASRAGHNRIQVYQENDESLKTQTDIHEWAGRIDRIFSENRLFARCQMIAPINPEKNSHSHYEILLGVRDEEGNIIPPDNFIPAVERCQRMPEIDRWVVENVFTWIVDNRRIFDSIGGFAINLSGQSLNSEEFLNYLKDRLAVQDVPPDKITFEVTESVAAGSLAFTKRFIREIKQFGCKFSLDDFGTGYSSYSYLKSLDVDYLKIDGSFIKDIANSLTDQVMVNSMNEIAHSLELETIAEYVENMTIHTILKEIGVDYAQGWGIHKPTPLYELHKSLN